MPPQNRRRRRRHGDARLDMLSPEDREAELLRRKADLSLAEAGLVVRTVNTLEERNITTVADALEQEADDLLEIPNFGQKTLKELHDCIIKLGLTPPRSWKNQLPRDS